MKTQNAIGRQAQLAWAQDLVKHPDHPKWGVCKVIFVDRLLGKVQLRTDAGHKYAIDYVDEYPRLEIIKKMAKTPRLPRDDAEPSEGVDVRRDNWRDLDSDTLRDSLFLADGHWFRASVAAYPATGGAADNPSFPEAWVFAFLMNWQKKRGQKWFECTSAIMSQRLAVNLRTVEGIVARLREKKLIETRQRGRGKPRLIRINYRKATRRCYEFVKRFQNTTDDD